METVAGAVALPLGLAALGVASAHRYTRSQFEPLRAKFEQACVSRTKRRGWKTSRTRRADNSGP